MLHNRQREFMHTVLGLASQPTVPVLMPDIRESAHSVLTPAARMNIYRRNIVTTLRAALGDIYPTTKSIMGPSFFLAAADIFIQQTPSPSGDLNQFGREWPDFLADYLPGSSPVSSHACLHDMARLDWAWHEAFHAAESAPLDLSRLAVVPGDQHASLVFSLHPSVRLIKSAHSLFHIWQTHQPEDSPTDSQSNTENEGNKNQPGDAAMSGDCLMVYRDDADVTLMKLTEAQYVFLNAFAEQQVLADAADAAMAADATQQTHEAFELHAFLIYTVEQNIIVDFTGAVY